MIKSPPSQRERDQIIPVTEGGDQIIPVTEGEGSNHPRHGGRRIKPSLSRRERDQIIPITEGEGSGGDYEIITFIQAPSLRPRKSLNEMADARVGKTMRMVLIREGSCVFIVNTAEAWYVIIWWGLICPKTECMRMNHRINLQATETTKLSIPSSFPLNTLFFFVRINLFFVKLDPKIKYRWNMQMNILSIIECWYHKGSGVSGQPQPQLQDTVQLESPTPATRYSPVRVLNPSYRIQSSQSPQPQLKDTVQLESPTPATGYSSVRVPNPSYKIQSS